MVGPGNSPVITVLGQRVEDVDRKYTAAAKVTREKHTGDWKEEAGEDASGGNMQKAGQRKGGPFIYIPLTSIACFTTPSGPSQEVSFVM